MKLLFDQNLSPRLVGLLADLYPDSAHVQSLGLACGSDAEIWAEAHDSEFVIVTKDEDFEQLSLVNGSPPQVIWLQIGNCTTGEVEDLLRRQHQQIETFTLDKSVGVLILVG